MFLNSGCLCLLSQLLTGNIGIPLYVMEEDDAKVMKRMQCRLKGRRKRDWHKVII
jgi:hypothetical protein